jgi:hypothetical protein
VPLLGTSRDYSHVRLPRAPQVPAGERVGAGPVLDLLVTPGGGTGGHRGNAAGQQLPRIGKRLALYYPLGRTLCPGNWSNKWGQQ